MHRNTLLFVACLAVIAALVVGIQIGRKTTIFDQGVPTPTPVATTTPTPATVVYTNATCGVTLTYPNSLQEVEGSTSGTILASITNPASSVVIICQKDIPRVPLPPEKIETVALTGAGGATISAKLYHDASQKDGTPIDKLIFTNPKTGVDIFIGGFGEIFNQVIRTIKLL